jgi:hypothetical protein
MLAHTPAGDPVVLASVTASDVGPLGTGACTYEPSAATGIIITRRVIKLGWSNTLAATGVCP